MAQGFTGANDLFDVATDSGTATVISNSISIVGGGSVSTSASGSTITVTGSGSGDVSGPGSSTDRSIATWNGTGGDTLYDNPSITISSAGEMVNTLQPAFSASLGANVTNATGDNTTYTIAFDTEEFDQNGDFGSNTFTAPVTGLYMFYYQISLANLAVGHTSAIVTIAGINAARFQPFICQSSGGIVTFGGSYFKSMAATNTATMAVTVTGSTKTVTVVSGTGGTFFQGFLVC